ncbi:hypothetical protein IQ270_29880 [Microcoleus sp. LEGE 07076]|uniref:hypothetical protein n=1 Tax=Microcoleus sp. LEGE 07076 TaxID=915322 RepID=UPI0018812106|nr:hypothetical protein [Microcoleus sp. LEGE 07076]MBE9188725.1 hypothetical protein [Microcoleus sp. LEGE 07076]
MSAAAASPAFAEGPYLGATYNSLGITDSRIGGVELDVDTLGIVGGYELSPNLAVAPWATVFWTPMSVALALTPAMTTAH